MRNDLMPAQPGSRSEPFHQEHRETARAYHQPSYQRFAFGSSAAFGGDEALATPTVARRCPITGACVYYLKPNRRKRRAQASDVRAFSYLYDDGIYGPGDGD